MTHGPSRSDGESSNGMTGAQLSRRMFLGRTAKTLAGVTLIGGVPGLLAACSSDKKTTDTTAAAATETTVAATETTAAAAVETTAAAATETTAAAAAAADLGKLTVQLSWFKNVEFAGDYLAEQGGYYKEAGFSESELIAGGPDVDTLALVLSNKALIAYTGSETVAGAINENGAKLKIIGVQYQDNPFCILSLEDKKPIRTAADMKGKTIGVQAANEPVWVALLAILGLEEGDGPDKVKKVPAGFDPAPLESGEMDGFFSFATNEPNNMKAKGEKPVVLLLDTLGFKLFQQLYVCTEDTFTNDKAKLVACMKATAKGWQEAIADQPKSIQVTMDIYGKDLNLDPKSQPGEAADQAKFLEGGSEVKTKGIIYMSDADIAENLKTLELLKLSIPKETYTNEIMDEVYKDGIVLFPGYTPGMTLT